MGILQPRQAWGCRFRQLRLRLDLDLGAIFLAAVSREYDKQIPAFSAGFLLLDELDFCFDISYKQMFLL